MSESVFFTLNWENELTGHKFETDYWYHGTIEQEKYTSKGWKLHCIAWGKSNGFTYRGEKK